MDLVYERTQIIIIIKGRFCINVDTTIEWEHFQIANT